MAAIDGTIALHFFGADLTVKLLALASLVLITAGTSLSAQSKVPAKATALRYVVAPTGNEARYRVREQLVGIDLPQDAIGATKGVSGRVVVGADGKVVKDSSSIIIQLADLKSDETRRDNFLRRRTLETSTHPTATLVLTALDGLQLPLPPGASQTFRIHGDLTVRGVTKPTTWQVTARTDGSDLVGTATTAFTFKDFGLDQPRVPVVLSVADTIRLEYDFRLVPEAAK